MKVPDAAPTAAKFVRRGGVVCLHRRLHWPPL